MFPETHKQLGLKQIPKLQEGILKKECVENEVQLKKVKERFRQEIDR